MVTSASYAVSQGARMCMCGELEGSYHSIDCPWPCYSRNTKDIEDWVKASDKAQADRNKEKVTHKKQ
jgi:hypothetical protein